MESRKRFLGGRLIGSRQSQETLKPQAIGGWKFELQVAQVVKVRDDQNLEHHPRTKRRPSSWSLGFAFRQTTRRHWLKKRPGHHLVEAGDRVTEFMEFIEFFKARGLVKAAAFFGLDILGVYYSKY